MWFLVILIFWSPDIPENMVYRKTGQDCLEIYSAVLVLDILGIVVEKYPGQFGHWINWSAWFKKYGQIGFHIYKAVWSIDICDSVVHKLYLAVKICMIYVV